MKSLLLFAPALLIAAPAAAQSHGEVYRAVGSDPSWSLRIDRGTISYRPARGGALTVAKPRPIIGIAGEIYRARGLSVSITHGRCTDAASGRTYRDTVRLTVGRRELNGCGGALVAADDGDLAIAGSSWRIAAIDGRAVRLEAPATVNFTTNRIQGRICNSYGGDYRFVGGTLTADRIIATQMACIGGASTVETAFLSALRQPLKVRRDDADTITLSNARSTVTLRRAG